MEKYIPDIYQKSIYNIDYQKLMNRGIKCLLFDLDNTILPIHVREVNDKLKDFFQELKEKNFELILFSNASKKRVKEIAEFLSVAYYARARKPFKKNFLQIMEEKHLNVAEIAIIGDQIFTDILGGNKVGITTVLVNPISTNDLFLTKINRSREKKIMKKLRDRDLFSKGRYYE